MFLTHGQSENVPLVMMENKKESGHFSYAAR